MNVLALEYSTPQCSVAIIGPSGVRTEASTFNRERGSAFLFRLLAQVMNEANLDWEAIDLFAAGRGPGAFSGMRMALTTAQTLALPLEKPVYAVSSGEAMAWELAQTGSTGNLAIIGDARRQRLWRGVFSLEQGEATLKEDWSLVPLDQWVDGLEAGTQLCTSEHERLAAELAPTAREKSLVWPTSPHYPSASAVGQLALKRLQAGVPSPPLEPLYMHPAVFVAPRFS